MTSICPSTSTRSIDYKPKSYDDRFKPIIARARWGRTDVAYQGAITKYRDVIVWPEGSTSWDWTLSNTHHQPGIQIKEIRTLVEHYHCDLIILSKGFDNVLDTDDKTISWLRRHRIRYEILNSLDAIQAYNANTTDRVGLLLHSTC